MQRLLHISRFLYSGGWQVHVFVNILWQCKRSIRELKQWTFLRSQTSGRLCRSGSSTAFVARKAKIKQWMVFGITRVTDVLSVFYTIWNVFTHDIAFRISERSLLLKGTHTFSLLHSHLNVSSFTFIFQAWNAILYYLIV